MRVMKSQIKIRELRKDDIGAIVRWFDDPAYLCAFAQTRLTSQEIQTLRQSLESLLGTEQAWVGIIDNIRVAAVLLPRGQNHEEGQSAVHLIPRLRSDWSLAEREILFVLAEKMQMKSGNLEDQVVRLNHSPVQVAKDKKLLRPIDPIVGRTALLLGPDQRNRMPISCLEHAGFTVTQSMNHEEAMALKRFDIVVSSGYDRRLPESFVSQYKDRILNIHAARLPWGRGIGTTLFSALLGYPLGVSIHYIDVGLDTGDIIAETDVAASRSDTLRTIYSTMLEVANQLFDSTLRLLMAGRAYRSEQPEVLPNTFARNRADFEEVLKVCPLGYDTPLFEVAALGTSMRALHAARTMFLASV